MKFHKFLKMDVPKKCFLNHLLALTIHKRVLLVVHNLTQRTVKFFQNFLCSWTSWVLLSRPQLVRNHFLASLSKRWYVATCWSLPMKLETSELRLLYKNFIDYLKKLLLLLILKRLYFMLSMKNCKRKKPKYRSIELICLKLMHN